MVVHSCTWFTRLSVMFSTMAGGMALLFTRIGMRLFMFAGCISNTFKETFNRNVLVNRQETGWPLYFPKEENYYNFLSVAHKLFIECRWYVLSVTQSGLVRTNCGRVIILNSITCGKVIILNSITVEINIHSACVHVSQIVHCH